MPETIVGSVGVQLVPSAEGFAEKARAKLRDLKAEVRLDADTEKAKAELDEAAHDRKSEIKADADTAEAEAKLDRAARNRTSRIDAKVDNLPRGLGLLGTSIVGLGPALVPTLAAVGGLTAALAAPLATAGAGGTLYGLIAGLTVSKTQKTNQALTKLRDKIEQDKKAVASAATAASKQTAQKTLAQDTAQYQKALASVTPAQKKFLDAESSLSSTFTRFSRRNGSAILSPLTAGLGVLNTLLPKASPLIHSVSTALSGLIGEVDHWAKSKGADNLIGFLSSMAGRSITGLGHILGNVATGIGSMVKAAAPMGGSVLDAIEGWSKGFRSIGQSKGFKDFLGYVHDEGPDVAHTLGDVAGATAHILKALAPIGHVSLTAIDGLAKGIQKIPTGVLTTAGGALAGILVSLKGIHAAKGALGFLSKIPKVGGLLGRVAPGAGLGGELGRVGGKGVVPVYVTNKGFGGPGGSSPTVIGNAEKKGASTAEKGALGKLRRFFGKGGGFLAGAAGPIGLGVAVGSVTNSLGLNPFKGERAPKGFEGQVKDVKAFNEAISKSSDLTRKQAQAQAGLNKLLLSPAMPQYAKQLRSLPKQVQTKVLTPGAIQSGKDIAALTKQYHLTPKQVKTLVNLLGQEGALRKTIELGRQYNLTPKQVKTIIAQSGMDSSQREIEKLAHQYNITPKQVRTLIRADNSQALGAVNAAQRMINSLHGKTVTIRTVRETSYYSKRKGIPLPGQAAGGTVPKGGAYRDKYPYLLAPGEEVVSNRYGQADRWRPLLKAINAGRLADGGTVRTAIPAATVMRPIEVYDVSGDPRQTAREVSRRLAFAGGA